jgi:hypothetical protein
MSDLQEIKRALSIDLSPAAVQSLRPTFDKAKSKGLTVNEKLDALDKELTEVMGGMSPKGASK